MKLQVNAANTVRNFSCVMTNKLKFIGEMLQNARRAGATLVDFSVYDNEGRVDVVVHDNGVGIANFATLFTLSESGWSDEVSQAENAFGMGFFSTLFVCKTMIVQSNGKRLDVDCEMAKLMEDFGEPLEDGDCSGLTRITLKDVAVKAADIKYEVSSLASKSRISVSFNGELLAQHQNFKALSAKAKHVVSSPFGDFVILHDWELATDIVVQDVSVGRYGVGYYFNYLFSDSLQCRMPDRDRLVNESQVKEEIILWLGGYYAQRLQVLRAEIGNDEAFLNAHFDAVVRFCPKILLEIDYLPACAFQAVCYETKRDEYEAESFSHQAGLRKGEEYIGFENAVGLWESPAGANFAYFGKARIPLYGLPDGHWFFDGCIDAQDSDFVIRCKDGLMFSFSLQYMGNGTALVAKGVVIEHVPSGKIVTLNGAGFSSFLDGGHNFIHAGSQVLLDDMEIECPTVIICGDEKSFSDALLLQVCSYQNGSDEYQDTDLELDYDSFVRQFITATEGNVENVLSQLLGELPPILAEKLNGKAMNVVFENGLAKFKLLAA